jgi:hypothetical protein
MSFSSMIFPPPVPPSFFNLAASKISSLSIYHGIAAAGGLVCTAKALFDIQSANSNPQANRYFWHAVAGLVSTTALTCLGVFGGSVALSTLGCAGIVYTFCAVYQIGQANPSLKGLVCRAYFGLAVTALIPVIGAGFGAYEVIGRILRPDEVTICGPFL